MRVGAAFDFGERESKAGWEGEFAFDLKVNPSAADPSRTDRKVIE